MMKTIYLLLYVTFITQIASAQTWSKQVSGTKNKLWNIYFVDNQLGFACGNEVILKTTNGGIQWEMLSFEVKDEFVAIQFVNSNLGYVSGSNGTLLKTANGGNKWDNISPNISDRKGGGIWFTSADTGFLALGTNQYSNSKILKTRNGGLVWDTVYRGTGWISYIYFSDAKHGWATASGSKVVKTIDGGDNWTVLDVNGGWMSGVYFFNKDTGFVSGGKCISYPDTAIGSTWKTIDGGSTWYQVFNNSSSGAKIFFANADIGFSLWADCTGLGSLMKTTDGGNTWVKDLTTQDNLRGLFFMNADNGYAVGDSGIILKYGNSTFLKNLGNDKGNINVYPNPTNQSATIVFDNPTNDMYILTLYDNQGRLVQTITNVTTNKVEINRKNLMSGYYFLQLSKGRQIIASGKLKIE